MVLYTFSVNDISDISGKITRLNQRIPSNFEILTNLSGVNYVGGNNIEITFASSLTESEVTVLDNLILIIVEENTSLDIYPETKTMVSTRYPDNYCDNLNGYNVGDMVVNTVDDIMYFCNANNTLSGEWGSTIGNPLNQNAIIIGTGASNPVITNSAMNINYVSDFPNLLKYQTLSGYVGLDLSGYALIDLNPDASGTSFLSYIYDISGQYRGTFLQDTNDNLFLSAGKFGNVGNDGKDHVVLISAYGGNNNQILLIVDGSGSNEINMIANDGGSISMNADGDIVLNADQLFNINCINGSLNMTALTTDITSNLSGVNITSNSSNINLNSYENINLTTTIDDININSGVDTNITSANTNITSTNDTNITSNIINLSGSSAININSGNNTNMTSQFTTITTNTLRFPNLTNGICHFDISGFVTSSLIVNGDIAPSAGIENSKLQGLPTSTNTINTIVLRDASGNFSAGNITVTNETITSFNTAGVVHNDASGVLSTSLIVNADILASAAIAYSKLNLSGSIVNNDISPSAAIAYSKLNLSGSIVNNDISPSAAIAYSKLNLSGSIVNNDISPSAAIANSKLAGNPTSVNTANTIVLRDASGNFNAGTITASTFLGTTDAILKSNSNNVQLISGTNQMNMTLSGTTFNTQNLTNTPFVVKGQTNNNMLYVGTQKGISYENISIVYIWTETNSPAYLNHMSFDVSVFADIAAVQAAFPTSSSFTITGCTGLATGFNGTWTVYDCTYGSLGSGGGVRFLSGSNIYSVEPILNPGGLAHSTYGTVSNLQTVGIGCIPNNLSGDLSGYLYGKYMLDVAGPLRLNNLSYSSTQSSTSGAFLSITNGTVTDSTTNTGGTLSNWSANYMSTPTLAASNTGVTTTNASTLYIEGAPIQGTNETITNRYALNVASGSTNLSGDVIIRPFNTAGILHNNSTGLLSSSLIVNADVSASAAIVDTKLATISTAGKIANSALSAITKIGNNQTGNASNSVAFGDQALGSSTSANFAVAIGPTCQKDCTSGGSNTAMGYAALLNNQTGSLNTAIGRGSLELTPTSITGNTCVGYNSGNSLSGTGSNNTLIGRDAGSAMNTVSGENTCVGYLAGSHITGSYNSCFGIASGRYLGGTGNVILGASCLPNANVGCAYNVVIGYNNCGLYANSESNNIVIGNSVGVAANESNIVRIGNGSVTDNYFNGNVRSTTFMGDLSGTINTGTTGTTQAANTNNTTIASTAYCDTQINIIKNNYTLIKSTQSVGGTATPAATYCLTSGAGVVLASGGSSNANFADLFYLDSARYASINGSAPRLRVYGLLSRNATSLGTTTFTLGLYPWSATAGSPTISNTLGTLVSGSNGAAWVNPSTSTTSYVTGLLFTFPATGIYCLGLVISNTTAANSFFIINAYLEMVYN